MKHQNRIRELALEKGMLISVLARVLNMGQLSIYDLASGKRLPTFETERKLELVFGIPITEIYPDSYKGLAVNLNLIPGEEIENTTKALSSERH